MRPPPAPDPEAAIQAALRDQNWPLLERLCDQHDTADHPVPQLLPSALWYASVGLAVFPLQAGSKVPLRGSRGCKDASTDPDQIRQWWQSWPQANIGLATGGLVDVIDIDGPVGVASWARLDELPEALGTVSTPRPGGSHLYVAAVPGLRNRTKIAPGIDFRGAGGYVVAPPSYVVEEAYEGIYRWRRPLRLPTMKAAA